MADLRILRVPHSTNVDRIALAAGHKALEVDWVDVDPDDRRVVREASGQDLVPVLLADDEVVIDSPRILAWIEARFPEPSLWPSDPGDAALADVFCHRFNEVWKGPPNRLAALLGPVDFDHGRLSGSEARAVGDDTQRLRRWLDRFEERLDGLEHLGGDGFGICDVTAHPFLRFGAHAPEPGDEDPFHRVLHELGAFDDASHPRLTAWVARVDARPRA
ncbi:glutathione S-transferase family protein [Patulibacter sp.]|uniref:glutathione S-transferase family protein n=1 Tax=Patulibacter sp. TaxID=1912859 RepID=UPI0027270B78|nr:glutathione S-transferase family protein [Patulibacter sp.]MDO9408139.1 glutathione S-transferase family protein [Patulibacter sp.]